MRKANLTLNISLCKVSVYQTIIQSDFFARLVVKILTDLWPSFRRFFTYPLQKKLKGLWCIESSHKKKESCIGQCDANKRKGWFREL